MSADRFWEITCDFRDSLGRECQEVADTASTYLRDVRQQAAAQGWARGPNDTDYCPKHAHHAERPA
jgi:hypothetical protein